MYISVAIISPYCCCHVLQCFLLVLLLLHHGIEVAVSLATGCHHLVVAVLDEKLRIISNLAIIIQWEKIL